MFIFRRINYKSIALFGLNCLCSLGCVSSSSRSSRSRHVCVCVCVCALLLVEKLDGQILAGRVQAELLAHVEHKEYHFVSLEIALF